MKTKKRAPARKAARKQSAPSDRGRRVLEIEGRAVLRQADRLSGERAAAFDRAVGILLAAKGKIVVTGMGKSGAIGRKLAATLASTGSPAAFLHAAEASHGDIGILAAGDAVVAISFSGETEELAVILPPIRRLEIPLVALTGRAYSTLARAAEAVILVEIVEEACPMGLAPTASTTATLALADALAVALYEARGLSPEDFAFRHPGGALGRRLLRAIDLAHTGAAAPAVPPSATLGEAILEMSRKRLGMTAVVEKGRAVGILTDGDLRRLLEKNLADLEAPVSNLASPSPRSIEPDLLAAAAVARMEAAKITSLLLADDSGRYLGVLHLHDCLSAKVV